MQIKKLLKNNLVFVVFCILTLIWTSSAYAADDFRVFMVHYDSRVDGGNTVLYSNTPYYLETENTLSGFIKLQVNLVGIDVQQSYAAGELEFKVYGLEKFGLTKITVLGDLFTYEHHTGTYNTETRTFDDDFYIVKNKYIIEKNSSIDSFFQMTYSLERSEAGCPVNGSVGTAYVEYKGQKTGETEFEFHLGKTVYAYTGSNVDVVEDYEVKVSNPENYYWYRINTIQNQTLKILGVPFFYYSVAGLPEGSVVYDDSRDFVYNRETNEYDYTEDYYNYQGTRFIVGIPVDSVNVGDTIRLTIKEKGEYTLKFAWREEYDEVEEVNIEIKEKSYITGTIIYFQIYSSASPETISVIKNKGYSSNNFFSVVTNEEYRLALGFDGVYIRNEGEIDNITRINKNDYHITSMQFPQLTRFYGSLLYETYDLYVKYRNSEDYVLYGTGYEPGSHLTFPENNITAFYTLSSSVTGSVSYVYYSRVNIKFDNIPSEMQSDSYIATYGFIDLYNPDSLTSILSESYYGNSNYTDLLRINLPEIDMSEFGRYRYRGAGGFKLTPESFSGYIKLADVLDNHNSVYSDYTLNAFLNIESTYTSVNDLKGYDFYVVLPKQIVLKSSSEDLKSMIKFCGVLPQFDHNQYGCFLNSSASKYLAESITVNTINNSDKTIVHYNYQFPEPLSISSDGSFLEMSIPVRVYDSDIMDYGSTINIDAYAQPVFYEMATFKQGWGGNECSDYVDVFAKLIINNRQCYTAPTTDSIDIDGDGNTEELFNVFHSSIAYAKATESLLEIIKLTGDENASFNQTPKSVYTDSEYSYRLRAKTATMGITDLVLYDSIESYIPAGLDSWHGEFVRFGDSYARQKGYTPTIYYSSSESAGKLNEDSSWHVYTGAETSSDVKSIAIDFGSQTIPPATAIYIDIIMKAPAEKSDLYAYNNFYSTCKVVDPETDYVYPNEISLESNTTILSLEKSIAITKSVTIEKEWDVSEQIEIPNSVTVSLLQDESEYDVVTLSKDREWTETISLLPWFAEDGHEYSYSVQESELSSAGFTVTYSVADGNLIVHNELIIRAIEVQVEKVWDDNDDEYGLRPDSVTFEAFPGDSEEPAGNCSTDKEHDWKCTITDLDIFDSDKNPVIYTIKEKDTPKAYDASTDTVDASEENISAEITNTLVTKNVQIKKLWEDSDNRDGFRPESIQFNLLCDESECGDNPYTLAESDTWLITIPDLPIYNKEGEPFVYSVVEKTE